MVKIRFNCIFYFLTNFISNKLIWCSLFLTFRERLFLGFDYISGNNISRNVIIVNVILIEDNLINTFNLSEYL